MKYLIRQLTGADRQLRVLLPMAYLLFGSVRRSTVSVGGSKRWLLVLPVLLCFGSGLQAQPGQAPTVDWYGVGGSSNIYHTGRVGVNMDFGQTDEYTWAPIYDLDVMGSMGITDYLKFFRNDPAEKYYSTILHGAIPDGPGSQNEIDVLQFHNYTGFVWGTENRTMAFEANDPHFMRFTKDGLLGVGVWNPLASIHADGDIFADGSLRAEGDAYVANETRVNKLVLGNELLDGKKTGIWWSNRLASRYVSYFGGGSDLAPDGGSMVSTVNGSDINAVRHQVPNGVGHMWIDDVGSMMDIANGDLHVRNSMRADKLVVEDVSRGGNGVWWLHDTAPNWLTYTAMAGETAPNGGLAPPMLNGATNLAIRNKVPGSGAFMWENVTETVMDLNSSGNLHVKGVVDASGFLIDGEAITTGSSLWSEDGSNIYFNTGNVGIGKTNPNTALDVLGEVNVDGGVAADNLTVAHSTAGGGIFLRNDNNPKYNIYSAKAGESTPTAGAAPAGLNNAFNNMAVRFGTWDNWSSGFIWEANATNDGDPRAVMSLQASTGNLALLGRVDAAAYYIDGSPVNFNGLWSENGANIHFNTGNVGIGMENPWYPLDVAGDIRGEKIFATDRVSIVTQDVNSFFTLRANRSAADEEDLLAQIGMSIDGDQGLYFKSGVVGDNPYTMVINRNGNVGIGRTVASEKLDVEGNIKASGTIEATGFVNNGFLENNGNLEVDGTLMAEGDISSNSDISAAGTITATGDMTGYSMAFTRAVSIHSDNPTAHPQFAHQNPEIRDGISAAVAQGHVLEIAFNDESSGKYQFADDRALFHSRLQMRNDLDMGQGDEKHDITNANSIEADNYVLNGQTYTSTEVSDAINRSMSGGAGYWNAGIEPNEIYYSLGSVGIGVNDPDRSLHVRGDAARIDRVNGEPTVFLATTNAANEVQHSVGLLGRIDGGLEIRDYDNTTGGGGISRMTINDQGHVGFGGVTEPQDKLHVRGSSIRIDKLNGNPSLKLIRLIEEGGVITNREIAGLQPRDGGISVRDWDNDEFGAGTERMFIDNAGDTEFFGEVKATELISAESVGIGTDDPQESLHASGDAIRIDRPHSEGSPAIHLNQVDGNGSIRRNLSLFSNKDQNGMRVASIISGDTTDYLIIDDAGATEFFSTVKATAFIGPDDQPIGAGLWEAGFTAGSSADIHYGKNVGIGHTDLTIPLAYDLDIREGINATATLNLQGTDGASIHMSDGSESFLIDVDDNGFRINEGFSTERFKIDATGDITLDAEYLTEIKSIAIIHNRTDVKEELNVGLKEFVDGATTWKPSNVPVNGVTGASMTVAGPTVFVRNGALSKFDNANGVEGNNQTINIGNDIGPNSFGVSDADINMYVEGTILAEGFMTNSVESWADHVFDEDYELKSLKEVETFIEEHKHLPDVPSEAKIREQGYREHDMNVIFLQKIEELTLYLIRQQAEIESLKQQVQNKSK